MPGQDMTTDKLSENKQKEEDRSKCGLDENYTVDEGLHDSKSCISGAFIFLCVHLPFDICHSIRRSAFPRALIVRPGFTVSHPLLQKPALFLRENVLA